jgi:carbamoyl-phosphate synthase large subunit
MAKYNIFVTGLNATDDPSSGLGVIRCLKETADSSIKIIGLTYGLLNGTSFLNHLVDEVYAVPFPLNNEEAYLSRLRQLIDPTKINVFLPNLDFEIEILSHLTHELRDLGLNLLLPKESAIQLCKKENIVLLSQKTGILCPYSFTIYSPSQIDTGIVALPYPLIVKAVKGDSIVVYDYQEAIVFIQRSVQRWGWPIVLQSFIPGDEFSVVALADRRHRVTGSVCMKRIVKSKNHAVWMGATVQEEMCLTLAKKLIEDIQWIGPIEINFIKLANPPTYYICDVHPRFPSWIQLACKAGCNLVKSAVLLALKKEVKPYEGYKTGILFARSQMDSNCDIGQLAKLAIEKELIYHEHHQAAAP